MNLYAQSVELPKEILDRLSMELEKRNIEEAVFKAQLAKQGIDLNDVSPDQFSNLQERIEEALEIIEIERKREAKEPIDSNKLESVVDDITALGKKVGEGKEIAKDSSQVQVKGENLPDVIYGHHIFDTNANQNEESQSPVSSSRIPNSYVLGVGDEITISIFGASQFDAKFEINEEGHIEPPQMPKIFLRGVRWEEAKKLIANRFSRFYRFRSDQIALSISSPPRLLTVHIFGEVKQLGSYDIVSTQTPFNALLEAGGPTNLGSVRDIQIIRDKEQKNLDIYEILFNPISQFQAHLEDGDILHVPIAEKIVTIIGAIRRPLRYELKSSEKLKDLIKYAGGFTANAANDVLQIKRFSNGQQILLDVKAADIYRQDLKNGDIIIVKEIIENIENSVSITGAVELPGEYALPSTPRISSLVRKAKLKRAAKLDVAFLVRENPDSTNTLLQLNLEQILTNPGLSEDIELQPKDKLIIHKQNRYVDRATITVKGAVRDSLLEYAFDPDSTITVQQAILLAGGLSPEANEFGYIIRANQNNDNDKEYLKINIKEAFSNPSSTFNLTLKPKDELRVLLAADYKDIATVTITGEVQSPDTLAYHPSLKIQDVLNLAGGFTKQTGINRIDIYRQSLAENERTKTIVATIEVDESFNIITGASSDFSLKPYDELVVRLIPEFNLFVTIEGEIEKPGVYALISKNERLSDLIRQAGGLTKVAFPEGTKVYRSKDNTGYMVTQLDKALSNTQSKYNYLLKEGDIISIPKTIDFVIINTANTRAGELHSEKYIVSDKVNVPFEAGKSAKWYINEYVAGFEENASDKNILVEFPSGAVKRVKKIGPFKVYPKLEKGATISVEQDVEAAKDKQDKPNRGKFGSTLKKIGEVVLGVGITIATVLLAREI